MVNSANLKSALQRFTGSEQLFIMTLYPKMKYTEGVKFFAEQAGAYWFLVIVGTEISPNNSEDGWGYFINVVLEVKNEKAQIKCDDGNGNPLFSKSIDFTDCPEGLWQFYLVDNVFMVPGEY